MFTDIDFPPNNSSISPQKSKILFNLHWNRLEKLLPLNYSLIPNDISPNDICQGNLGDCWLLAAISCLANTPSLIKNIFITQKVNQEGKYIFKFYKDGCVKYITIDSFLPFTEDNKLYSANQKNSHYWVALLEKAYAKLHGSYSLLSEGDCGDALVDLTGLPTISILPNDKIKDLWKELLSFKSNNNCLITAAIYSETLPVNEKRYGSQLENGLLMNHVYSVIDLKECDGGPKLVQMRNPWGICEYNGEWSDNSQLWTDNLIKSYKLKRNVSDGVFYIGIDQFHKYFNRVCACVNENFKKARLESTLENLNYKAKANTIKLRTFDSGEYYIGLHQKDKREINAPKYIDLGALIVNKKLNKVTNIVNSNLRRISQYKYNLPAGEYEILVYSSGRHFGEDHPIRKFAVTIHSKSKFTPELKLLKWEKDRVEKAFSSACYELADNFPAYDRNYTIRILKMGDTMAVGCEATPKEEKKDQFMLLEMDLSNTTGVIPTINSVSNMKKSHIMIPYSKGMVVYKFVRQNEKEFNFECDFRLIGILKKN